MLARLSGSGATGLSAVPVLLGRDCFNVAQEFIFSKYVKDIIKCEL